MRPIDAEALENELRETIHNRHSKRTILALYLLLDIVRGRDTIKVKPIKYGEWVKQNDNTYPDYECSECGYHSNMKTPYCANCGSKMTKD